MVEIWVDRVAINNRKVILLWKRRVTSCEQEKSEPFSWQPMKKTVFCFTNYKCACLYYYVCLVFNFFFQIVWRMEDNCAIFISIYADY